MEPIDHSEEHEYPWNVYTQTKDPDKTDRPVRVAKSSPISNWKTKLGLNPVTNEVVQMHYTDEEAEGAIPNGTRIRKRNAEENDNVANGGLGRVIGSFKTPPMDKATEANMRAQSKILNELGIPVYGYFVEWDALPGIIVGTTSHKVEKLDDCDPQKR